MNGLFLLMFRFASVRDPSAFQQLALRIRELGKGQVVTRTGKHLRIPDDFQEDIAHDVIVKLGRDGIAQAAIDSLVASTPEFQDLLSGAAVPQGLEHKADVVSTRYLKVMLANRYLDVCEDRELAELDSEKIPAPEPSVLEPTPEARRRLELVTRALDHYVGTLRGAQAGRNARTAFSQVHDLALGLADMDELVEAESDPAAPDPEQESVLARNRLLTQHKRVRKGIIRSIDAMEAAGAMPPEDAETARSIIQFMLRRQKPDDPTS